ncbi:MAG: histidine phosphatase family protein [Actinobacteria bacterium]|nr:histidine phosphatase family protein [Actinomycetota bacterium]
MIAWAVYVRHAMPERRDDDDPDLWPLGPAGRAAAAELARRLHSEPAVGRVVASPAPKATQTAEPIAARFGLDVVTDDRLVEAGRPWVGEDYRVTAHRYVDGEPVEGWEPQVDVAARVAAAVADARSAAGAGRSIVVGHGLALAVHLRALLPNGFDAGGFWRRLAFPDAWELDPDGLVLSRPLR